MLYLGVDPEDEAAHSVVDGLRLSSIEHLTRVTGKDWAARTDVGTFNSALRLSVWLEYYTLRDETKVTPYLKEHLDGLICSLQLSGGGDT